MPICAKFSAASSFTDIFVTFCFMKLFLHKIYHANIMSKVYSPLCSSLVTQFEIIYKTEQLIKALKVISGYYAFFTTLSALCLLYEIVIDNLFRCTGARVLDVKGEV
ncbi:hypothetical protein Tsp_07503 [Trichinella spiralis]|uniref:hypothetical protein n=1 Tax=Trichinella spiralis TaxID=6334 RepID=UPI0001EFD13C|nr:hypothetical protein Tsp_07503 [Trichinella spiralis]